MTRISCLYLGQEIASWIGENDALVEEEEELSDDETSEIIRAKIEQQLEGQGGLHDQTQTKCRRPGSCPLSTNLLWNVVGKQVGSKTR